MKAYLHARIFAYLFLHLFSVFILTSHVKSPSGLMAYNKRTKHQLLQFWPMVSFYTPENTIKPLLFWCFQGVLKENICLNWVNQVMKTISALILLKLSTCTKTQMYGYSKLTNMPIVGWPYRSLNTLKIHVISNPHVFQLNFKDQHICHGIYQNLKFCWRLKKFQLEEIISNLRGLHKIFEKSQNGVKNAGPGIHVILGLGPNGFIYLVDTLHRVTIGKHFNVFRACLHCVLFI